VAYGPQGSGKSADLVASFPCARYGAVKGALDSARSLWGINPENRRFEARTMTHLTEGIKVAATDKEIDSVVADDASVCLANTFNYHEARAPLGRGGHPDGFYAHKQLEIDVLLALKLALASSLHVVFNLWEVPPNPEKSRIGGIMAPNAKAAEYVTGQASLVLHVGLDPDIAVGKFRSCYYIRSQADFKQKQRFHHLPDKLPMNIGEILRNCGFAVKRHPSMAWQEGEVERIALRLWREGSRETVLRAEAARLLEVGVARKPGDAIRPLPGSAVRWTLRDATARNQLWRTMRLETVDNLMDDLGI
jgi:hypothetical protein